MSRRVWLNSALDGTEHTDGAHQKGVTRLESKPPDSSTPTARTDYGYGIAPAGCQVPYDAMRQHILNSVPVDGQLVQQDATTWWGYFLQNTCNPTGKKAFKLFW